MQLKQVQPACLQQYTCPGMSFAHSPFPCSCCLRYAPQPLEYFSAPGISSSDHKPVGATFSVPTVFRHRSDGKPEVQLHLTQMSAQGLFVRRSHRDAKTTNTPPNPCAIIKVRFWCH